MKQLSAVGIIFSLIMTAMLALAAGCRHETPEALLRADALIEEHPDSAMAILDSITPAALPSERHRALHALLSTQARYQNYMPFDSLETERLKDYLNRHDDPEYRVRALYYAGCIDMEAGMVTDAMTNLLDAYDRAIESGDLLWAARAAIRVSELYYRQYAVSEALFYAERSSELFEKTGKRNNFLYAQIVMADAYTTSEKSDSALSIIGRIEDDVNRTCDPDVRRYMYAVKGNSLYLLNKYDEAAQAYREAMRLGPEEAENSILLSICLFRQGYPGEAEKILVSLDSAAAASPKGLLLAALVASDRQEWKKAFELSEKLSAFSEQSYDRRESSGLLNVYQEYLESRNQLAKEKLKSRNRLIWIIIVSSALLIMAGATAASYFIRRHRLMMSRKNIQIKERDETIRKKDLTITDTEKRLQDLDKLLNLKEQEVRSLLDACVNTIGVGQDAGDESNAIDRICEGLLSLKYRLADLCISSTDDKTQMPRQISDMVADFKSGGPAYTYVTETMDSLTDNSYTRLKADFPELKHDQLTLFVCVWLGLSNDFIQAVAKNTKSDSRVRKSRLKAKIAQSNCPNKNIYIDILERKSR